MASSKNGFEAKLLKAKDFKAQGTKFLNEGKFKAANDMYQKILDTLGGKEMGHHHETERKDLIQAGRLDIALCQMKMKEWKRAKSTCSKIIKTNNDVVKAWYRRGECYMNLNLLDEAINDFSNVVRIEPTNQAAINHLSECVEQKKAGLLRRSEQLELKIAINLQLLLLLQIDDLK